MDSSRSTAPSGAPWPTADDLTLAEQVSLLSGRDFWTTRDLPATGERAAVPSVHLSDGPHGLRVQGDEVDHLGLASSQPATCFPPSVTVASTWDPELARQVGAAVGREAQALGVGVVLGPGLNIKRHPLCGRNFEYFSEDPVVAGQFAAAIVEGIQSAGVGASVKHFAVNNQEDHRFVVNAVLDERTLHELYLAGFEHVVRTAHPWTVMAAYNMVNGVTATEHRELLTAVLRDEWGFDGLVMSDWGATGNRVAAVRAGMDLEMPGGHGLNDRVLTDAVSHATLPPADVARCANRVLDLARRAPAVPSGEAITDLTAEHDALARRVAAEGSVLLSNDGILPLAEDTRVAVIGAFADEPRIQGGGSSLVTPTKVTSVLDALRERGTHATYSPGYETSGAAVDEHNPALVSDAVQAAMEADVAVVLVGLPASKESEGWDRPDLDLPKQHEELVAAVCAVNPRTVVALSNGAPVSMPWAELPAAVLESYLGGQAGGGALVDVLFGDVEPAGRLAETFPVSLADVASTPWFPGRPRQVEYREGLAVGYRHCVTAGIAPAFAFGHGLGYGTTAWSGAEVTATEEVPDVPEGEALGEVRVTVTNTGDRATSDVVQVYLRRTDDPVVRPERWLAGFAKVRLEVGESRQVSVLIPRRSAQIREDGSWRTVGGDYDVLVARSSVDVAWELSLTVPGEGADPADASGADGADGADAADGAVGADAAGLASLAGGRSLVAVTDSAFEARLGRPLPTPKAVRPFTRDSTVGEIATTPLGRAVRFGIFKASPVDVDAEDEVSLLLFERSIDELPLRAVAQFSDGALTWPRIDSLLRLLNLQPQLPRASGRTRLPMLPGKVSMPSLPSLPWRRR